VEIKCAHAAFASLLSTESFLLFHSGWHQLFILFLDFHHPSREHPSQNHKKASVDTNQHLTRWNATF